MPRRALKVCSTPRCPNLTPSGRCDTCRNKAETERGSASERGYTSAGHQRFRAAVLTRDPICVCPDAGHGHQSMACLTQSTVADHHPISRRDLILRRLNPNAPSRGRGLCKSCHDKTTAVHQPGGWNRHAT